MNNSPDNLRIGGGIAASSIHPAVFVALCIAIILLFVLPRKYVVVSIFVITFLTPFGQQIYVAGVHMFVGRIVILCGLLRFARPANFSNGPNASDRFSVIDRVFLLWAAFRVVGTLLTFGQAQAAINQAGFLIDNVGGYLLLRSLIRSEEDVARVIKTLAVIVCILAVAMVNEKLRHQNIFGLIGGRWNPYVRDGAIRSQGSFGGPIPAGTFGATRLCLFLWLLQRKKMKLIGIAGVIGSTIMTFTSASSTPLLAFAAGILAISMWPLRRNMRTVRWGLVLLLTALHLAMKAPVWMIINHIDLVGGNSGYHRAALIDQCVRHFGDWWLIGVKSSGDWGWDMWDQANQFVAEAEAGGLGCIICFVLMVSWCFGRISRARSLVAGDRRREWSYWLLGCTLFSYVVSFFGISFSDQSQTAWLAFLAIIGALTVPAVVKSAIFDYEPVRVPRSDGEFADWSPASVAWRREGFAELWTRQ